MEKEILPIKKSLSALIAGETDPRKKENLVRVQDLVKSTIKGVQNNDGKFG